MDTDSNTDSNSSTVVAGQRVLPEGYTVEQGHLHLHGLDLAALAEYWLSRSGQDDAPLTIRYVPSVRNKFNAAHIAFARASSRTGYASPIRMAYASKANPNRAVIQATTTSGADYECTSRVDVAVIRYAIEQGWLGKDQLVIANGFKTPNYADGLLSLVADVFSGV